MSSRLHYLHKMGLAVPVVNVLSVSGNPPPTPEPADAAPGSAGRGSRSHSGGGSFYPGSARLSFLSVAKALSWMPHAQEAHLPVHARAPEAASCWRARPHARSSLLQVPQVPRPASGEFKDTFMGGLSAAHQQVQPCPQQLLSKSDGTSLPHGQLPGELCRHPPSVGRGGGSACC